MSLANRHYTLASVAWEITRACAPLSAEPSADDRPEACSPRDPRELATREGCRLIDDLVELGRPILILTGGDPLMRPDLEALVEHAARSGLEVRLLVVASPLATLERLTRLRDLGLSAVHLGLDGATADTHDAFRGAPGSYHHTLRLVDLARDLGLEVQVDTSATRRIWQELPAVAELVGRAGGRTWRVRSPVPGGRADPSELLDAAEHEVVLQWLYTVSTLAPFAVRTAGAPHYRRVVIQRERLARGRAADAPGADVRWELTGAGYAFCEDSAPGEQGVDDGRGSCFVSHVGDVYPGAWLPLAVGNVRERSVVALYRDAPLFRALRNPDLLRGRCGACVFRRVCGGSRARAYALSGDELAEDPACLYDPRQGGLPEVYIPLPLPSFARTRSTGAGALARGRAAERASTPQQRE